MQCAVLLVTRGLTGFPFQLGEKPGRILGKLGLCAALAQLSDDACRVPSGARGKLFALDQDRPFAA